MSPNFPSFPSCFQRAEEDSFVSHSPGLASTGKPARPSGAALPLAGQRSWGCPLLWPRLGGAAVSEPLWTAAWPQHCPHSCLKHAGRSPALPAEGQAGPGCGYGLFVPQPIRQVQSLWGALSPLQRLTAGNDRQACSSVAQTSAQIGFRFL